MSTERMPAPRAEHLETADNYFANALTELTDHPVALDSLAELVRMREDVEAAIVGQVQRARDQGRTWQTIADALGVSPQAAHKRYNEEVDPT